MTNPAPGTLAWFEVATHDPDGAQKFYGSLFDWSFATDLAAEASGMDYRNITASGGKSPMGGIAHTGGQMPDHAVFYILVADVGGHLRRGFESRRFGCEQADRAARRRSSGTVRPTFQSI